MHHDDHGHSHGEACGHIAIRHDDHLCYLHDGHLHCPVGGEVHEHRIAISRDNPAACKPGHRCGEHDPTHVHGPGCGHEAVPHGDHVCYLVGGHLHFPHQGHCDHHGSVQLG